jgi:rhodanese-related sulfurtransferase
MTERKVAAGAEIVRQGDPGDDFYLIWKGRAEVWQMGPHDDAPQRVAELAEGDAFGDEALVMGGTRNATVKMISDGELLVLVKEDFQALLSQPLVQEVAPEVAKAMLDSGVKPLDLRFQEEYEKSHLPGALLLPLPELRARADALLDRNARYVVYSRSGRPSAVGALLLSQRGYKVVSMKGGILSWPFEVETRTGD